MIHLHFYTQELADKICCHWNAKLDRWGPGITANKNKKPQADDEGDDPTRICTPGVLIPYHNAPHILRPWDGSWWIWVVGPWFQSFFNAWDWPNLSKFPIKYQWLSDLLRLGRLDHFWFLDVFGSWHRHCSFAEPEFSRKFDHARNSDITRITWQKHAETISKVWLQYPVERSSSMTHGCASSVATQDEFRCSGGRARAVPRWWWKWWP